ncbi:MAG: DinB family protein [Chthonomonadales bacterium]
MLTADGLPIVEPMEVQDVRRLAIWSKRVLRPMAAELTIKTACDTLESAELAFRETIFELSPEQLTENPAEGVMSPIDILAHITVTQTWQALRLREIRTDEVPPDDDVNILFRGANEKPYKEVLVGYIAAWERLLEEATSASDVMQTSKHIWFGQLTPKEWIVSAALHFDYHRSQLDPFADLTDAG